MGIDARLGHSLEERRGSRRSARCVHILCFMFYVVCGTCDWAFGLRPVFSFFVFVFVYSCVCGYWTLGILDIRQVVYKLVRKRGSGIPYLGVFGGTPPSAEAEGISALPRGRRANPSRFSASAASGLRLILSRSRTTRTHRNAHRCLPP